MPKLEDLTPATRRTIRHIAKSSGITPEKAIAIMLRPTNSHGVTTHLDYGTASLENRHG